MPKAAQKLTTFRFDDSPSAISFGAAGVLCLGVDAEVRQGCEAILTACDRFIKKRGFPSACEYNDLVLYIEARAKEVAPIAATSPAGMAAKAEVVQLLADPGMAMYAVRIMASSLARDVLAMRRAIP